jgi:RNA 2',3'-cyclic 3'-phosphodiesterase
VRLFVALRPPPGAVRHAAAAVDAVRAAHAGPRWVPAERWHLTLAFYGEVAERDVDRTARRVGRAVAGSGSMDLALAGAGSFARRALWLDVIGVPRDGADSIAGLRALARALAREPHPRAYRPHLTIARLRADTAPAAADAAVAALAGYVGPSWPAAEVHLVHSQVGGGKGPVYDDLATWPLPPATSADRS